MSTHAQNILFTSPTPAEAAQIKTIGPVVVGLGAMNMDQFLIVDELPRASTELQPESVIAAGGSAANTIYALGKLGVPTAFIGAVGDDPLGYQLVGDLHRVGVDTNHIQVKCHSGTGLAIVLSSSVDGARVSMVVPGANGGLSAHDVQSALDLVRNAKVLHLSSFFGAEQLRLQVDLVAQLAASPASPVISFAPGEVYARKGMDALRPILKHCTALMLNQDELGLLTSHRDVWCACRLLHKEGVQSVIVTLGGGARLSQVACESSHANYSVVTDAPVDHSKAVYTAVVSREERCYLTPAPASQPDGAIETTGAGDAFAAGVLLAMIQGLPVITWGHVGQAVARPCVLEAGARKGLPDLSELDESYRILYGHCLSQAPSLLRARRVEELVSV